MDLGDDGDDQGPPIVEENEAGPSGQQNGRQNGQQNGEVEDMVFDDDDGDTRNFNNDNADARNTAIRQNYPSTSMAHYPTST